MANKYFVVPARTRNGHLTCSIQVVDEKEKVIKSFLYPCDDSEAKTEAYLDAMDYVDELKRKEG